MLLNRRTIAGGSARARKVLLQADRDADAARIRCELSASSSLMFDVMRVTGADQALLCLPDWTPDIALLLLDLRQASARDMLDHYQVVLERVPAIVIAPLADEACRAITMRAGARLCISMAGFSANGIGRIFSSALWQFAHATAAVRPGAEGQEQSASGSGSSGRQAPAWPPETRLRQMREEPPGRQGSIRES